MYLSRLELFGFKSFPHKLSLEVGSGITCIVGPNGCGKTNVIDAIRWCLGEQSTKMLRSDKMEDVIFSGSQDEPALSMAEVSLVFSNEDGLLPVEYNEVSVTRRLFRSGESEYLMNNQVCRLKDVVDLFLNTGLGADSYSLIESKMIDTILSEDPSIRRSLFEEAAGVAKYRLQKRTAQRRMEATTEDLLRLQDIVSELEKRLRSLKRQASKARVYEKFSQELKQIDLQVAALDRDRLTAQAEQLKTDIAQWQEKRGELTARLEVQEGEITAAREALEANESQIGQLQYEINSLSEQLQQRESRQAVIKERRAGIELAMERREKDIRELMASIGQYDQQIRSLQDGLQSSSDSLSARAEQLKIKEAELSRVESDLTSAKLALSEARRELMESLKLEADGREQLSLLESRYGNAVSELDRLRQEADRLRRELEDGGLAGTRLAEKHDAQRRALQVLAEERLRLKQKSAEWQKQLLASGDALREASAALSGLRKEKDLLEGLRNKHEGFGQGVQYLLSRQGDLNGELKPLAELVEAEPGYQAAIEAALSESLQWLATEEPGQLGAALGLMRSGRNGKATLICPGLAPPVPTPEAAGTRGPAASFVRCQEKHRTMIEALLADVLVVESLDDPNGLMARHPGKRLVSLAGEVLHPHGAIEAGQLPEGQIGLLQRRDRIERLASEIAQAAERTSREEASIRSLRGKLEELEKQLEEIEKEAVRYQAEVAASETALAKHSTTMEASRDRLGQIEGMALSLQEGLGGLEQQLNASRSSFLEISESNKDENGILFQRDREVTAKEAERDRLAAEAGSLRLELSRAQAAVEQMRQEVANQEERKKEALDRIQGMRAEDEAGFSAIAGLQKDAESLGIEIESLSAKRQGLLNQREEMQRASQGSLARLKQAESVMHHSRLENEELGSRLSQAQIELGSVRNELENISGRLKADYEADLEALVTPADVNLEESRNRADDLRHRLKKLGPVNFAAFQELQEEEANYVFKTKQRDDVLAAKEDLANTIRKIDETARSQFLETFAAIRRGFGQIFQRLFVGGEADLKLTGSDDPLEAEIEILATPEGKSMKSIRLLSGGEKAMTATALLFGIYLVKPAPFCVLDELDAPLDDANVQRFCAMLKDFATGTQFLVITHNKRTMEVADRLYGVTMEKKGVSKVVSVKFD